jgi:hypothetical protein
MVEMKMKKSWSDSVLENRKYELFFLFLFLFPTKCVLNIYEKKKKTFVCDQRGLDFSNYQWQTSSST